MCHTNELVIQPRLQPAVRQLSHSTLVIRQAKILASTQTSLNSTPVSSAEHHVACLEHQTCFYGLQFSLFVVKLITERLQLSNQWGSRCTGPLYHAHKLLTTILSLTNYLPWSFQTNAKIFRVGNAHLDFFQGGHGPGPSPCRRPWYRIAVSSMINCRFPQLLVYKRLTWTEKLSVVSLD